MPEDATHQRLKRKRRSCHRTLDCSKGTPVPSTLARLTIEQRRKGQATVAKMRRTHKVGCNRRLLYTGACRCGARKG